MLHGGQRANKKIPAMISSALSQKFEQWMIIIIRNKSLRGNFNYNLVEKPLTGEKKINTKMICRVSNMGQFIFKRNN